MSPEERAELITEVDVLYGDEQPGFSSEKLSPPTMEAQGGRKEKTWLTIRRGVKSPPRPLHFSHDGKFKILQVADLHFSVADGPCHDVPPDFTCEPGAYSVSASLLSRTLDLEKLDLVVFTGD